MERDADCIFELEDKTGLLLFVGTVEDLSSLGGHDEGGLLFG